MLGLYPYDAGCMVDKAGTLSRRSNGCKGNLDRALGFVDYIELIDFAVKFNCPILSSLYAIGIEDELDRQLSALIRYP